MDTWKYHPSPGIDTPVSESLRGFPREPGMLAYAIRSVAALLLRAWMRTYHRLHIEGRENLPAKGSYVRGRRLLLLERAPLRGLRSSHQCAAVRSKGEGRPESRPVLRAAENRRKHPDSFPRRHFRSGIGRLAAGSDLDILPCHLEGGLRAWPKGKLLPRPRRLHLRIGQAKNYRHLDRSPESVKAVCADLEERVARLGGGAE
jgi:1-acyl-sn-glycerol-3-phosphate acyltransferase